jgi:hypothetical protein
MHRAVDKKLEGEHVMKKVALIFGLLFCVTALYAVDDVFRAVRGTITAIDSATKSVTIKAADGRERTFHFVEAPVVHVADASGKLVMGTMRDLKKGTEVAMQYAQRGNEDVLLEIDKLGRDGLKVTEGTVKAVDTAAKKLVVDIGRGAEDTFMMTEHAAKRAATDVGHAIRTGTKVTVYYTEDAGRKVAHFFEGK